MSVSYGRLGTSPFADLTAEEHSLLYDFINTNWSLTGTLAKATSADTDSTKVKLGKGWKTITHTYEVHCVKRDEPKPQHASTDWRLSKHSVPVDIHVFAKKTDSTGEEPANLGAIMRELRRIIEYSRQISAGLIIEQGGIRRADDPESMGTAAYFHRIIECDVIYWMASTS